MVNADSELDGLNEEQVRALAARLKVQVRHQQTLIDSKRSINHVLEPGTVN